MRKIGVLLFVLFFLCGCSAQPVSETTGKENVNNPSTENSTQVNSIGKSVYKRGFYEQEAIVVPKIMFLQGSESLNAFPYKEADSINEIKDTYVIIHTVVLNDEGEEWALVEFTDVVNMTNYGYLRLNRLNEKPYKPLYACNKEVISDVAIGDIVEKAVVQFGNKYETYKSESGWSYAFQKEKGYIAVFFDPISNTIEEINVTTAGYKTKEGYQVGDKAIKVLDSYKAKYEMNTGQHLFKNKPESIFNLGDGYVIEFEYEPKELGEESVITRIRYCNIYNGDW